MLAFLPQFLPDQGTSEHPPLESAHLDLLTESTWSPSGASPVGFSQPAIMGHWFCWHQLVLPIVLWEGLLLIWPLQWCLTKIMQKVHHSEK